MRVRTLLETFLNDASKFSLLKNGHFARGPLNTAPFENRSRFSSWFHYYGALDVSQLILLAVW